MIQGSSGDGAVVSEYMSFVCNSSELTGWKQQGCYSLARNVRATMTEDKYDNRENLNMTALCGRFWAEFSTEEEKRVEKEREIAEKERAEREAEEKKRAEEAAEEAKAKAEEAARSLEAKKQEAEKLAAEANRTKEEAQIAASAHAYLANRTNGTIGSNATNTSSKGATTA